MEEQQNKLLESLRKNRAWSFIIALTGLFFILFCTWKLMIHDPYFRHRGVEVHIILTGMVALGVFRYILFIRQQLALGKNTARLNEKKLEKYYQRSFYFWLFDGILTTAAAIFGLYLMAGDL